MLHLGLKYGQICDTSDLSQIYTYPSLQSGKQTLCGMIVMQKKREGRMDRGRK